jgi:tRNA-specific 2-thiouridylase
MKTWGFDDIPEKDSGCCSLETIYNARNVAGALGFPHYTLDFTGKFNEIVISNFIDEYLHGRTPNPCVLCNKAIKWGELLKKAESFGADYIATGHYAKVNFENGRYFISKADDSAKDQSYALWQLSQDSLSRTLFPLGSYVKPEIRRIAGELGLKSADTPDSQEICFVPEDNYSELLTLRLPHLKEQVVNGDIIYKDNIVGKHKGYPFYTIGQRRGLNIALGKAVYVSKIDPDKNIIYVDDEDKLYNSEFEAESINLMKLSAIEGKLSVNAKIRYKDTPSPALIEQISPGTILVKFEQPKKSITPGQSAVFYDGEDVIGGGIISKIIR